MAHVSDSVTVGRCGSADGHVSSFDNLGIVENPFAYASDSVIANRCGLADGHASHFDNLGIVKILFPPCHAHDAAHPGGTSWAAGFAITASAARVPPTDFDTCVSVLSQKFA